MQGIHQFKIQSGSILLFYLLMGIQIAACSPIKYEVEIKCPTAQGPTAQGLRPPVDCYRRPAKPGVDLASDGSVCQSGLVCRFPGQANCDNDPNHICVITNNAGACSCGCTNP